MLINDWVSFWILPVHFLSKLIQTVSTSLQVYIRVIYLPKKWQNIQKTKLQTFGHNNRVVKPDIVIAILSDITVLTVFMLRLTDKFINWMLVSAITVNVNVVIMPYHSHSTAFCEDWLNMPCYSVAPNKTLKCMKNHNQHSAVNTF